MIPEVKLINYIRNVPDWPKKGILFRDITPLLAEPRAFAASVTALCEGLEDVDYVAAVEARGFIFGAAVARELTAGFIPIRKRGKLPYETRSITYDLEYGSDTLEVHSDAVKAAGQKILMIDDLLATGGTMAAACKLIEKVGGTIVSVVFLIELSELRGREKLQEYDVRSVIRY